MKNPGLAPLFLVATLFLVPARAADQKAPLNPEAIRARMVEMFDENKDGRLDEAERAKAQKFAAERGLAGDGPMRAQLLQRFDQNGNGKIDDEERAAVQEFLRSRTPMAAATSASEPALPAIEFEQPAPERLALERVIRAAIAADAAQLKRFDDDRDGQLSDAEWSVARLEVQRTFNDGLVLAVMATEEEEKKMKAVVEEVARRRQEQDKVVVLPKPEEEKKRFEAVAREVAQRRQLMEDAARLVGGAQATNSSEALSPAVSSDPKAKAKSAIQSELRRRRSERDAADAALRVAAGGDEMRRSNTIIAELDLEFDLRHRFMPPDQRATASAQEKEKAAALDALVAEVVRLGHAKEPVARFIEGDIAKRRVEREVPPKK